MNNLTLNIQHSTFNTQQSSFPLQSDDHDFCRSPYADWNGTAQTRCGIELATFLFEEAVIIRSKHRRTQAQDTDLPRMRMTAQRKLRC